MQHDENYILRLFPDTRSITCGELRGKVIRTLLTAWKAGNYVRIEDVHQFEPARDHIPYTNVDHTNHVVQLCMKFAEALQDVL
jgi:hypothetical protein